MAELSPIEPESTALRVALWRALHLLADPAPHVLHDDVGLRLAGVEDDWRRRPDMHPEDSSRSRASIVARARFVEDLVVEQAGLGVDQYVLLGAGLDTFAQRKAAAPPVRVFEVDRPGPQRWKQQRLVELGYGDDAVPRFVPVDFEAGDVWWDALSAAGFSALRPAVVASVGVAMYLAKATTEATLRHVAGLPAGSSLVMSFMLPLDRIEPEERPGREYVERAARSAGTPFVSFYTGEELLELARQVGFRTAQHVSAGELARRYFAGRADGLRPSSSEELLVAFT